MRETPGPVEAHPGFHLGTVLEVAHVRTLPPDDYLRYARSWSYVGGAMDRRTLGKFSERLKGVLVRHHGDGPVTECLVTAAHFARRR